MIYNKPRSEVEHIIDEWIYNERDRRVMKRRLDGLTYEKLAEEFDLSTQGIKKIVYRSQEIITCHL